jgi:NAD(P)-dependent dehydrogenase (short-subunit alcohol dehydrogenase family)
VARIDRWQSHRDLPHDQGFPAAHEGAQDRQHHHDVIGRRAQAIWTPEDVAHAALYLASDDAAWIAGIILDVAGGAVMV